MRYVNRKMGSVDLLEVGGEKGAAVIVLFHGYGANAYDLLPLHQQLPAMQGASWYFPNGIEEAPAGLGRAWFPIDFELFQKALLAGAYQELAESQPPGLTEAGERAAEMLHEIMVARNIGMERLILGGFSQGAVVATELALQLPDSPAALLIFSGILVARERWRQLAAAKRGMPFFQSHGTEDMVLAFGAAQLLEQLLQAAGWKGKLIAFKGGHEIPPALLVEVENFLKVHLQRATQKG